MKEKKLINLKTCEENTLHEWKETEFRHKQSFVKTEKNRSFVSIECLIWEYNFWNDVDIWREVHLTYDTK